MTSAAQALIHRARNTPEGVLVPRHGVPAGQELVDSGLAEWGKWHLTNPRRRPHWRRHYATGAVLT